VIPRALHELEVAHDGLTDLRIVESMHARKTLMHELSDGFLALPGGLGTLDELFETLTWLQLGFHRKPVGLLEVNGYFDGLLAWLDRAVDGGMLRSEHRRLLLVDRDPEALLERMDAWRAPDLPRILLPGEQ
jgi:uncharacterized protein (TIGR00730 family)